MGDRRPLNSKTLAAEYIAIQTAKERTVREGAATLGAHLQQFMHVQGGENRTPLCRPPCLRCEMRPI